MPTLKELMQKVTAARHRARVVEFVIEQLNPCLDPDVGVAEKLRADGCAIPDVPQEVVLTVIAEHVTELQRLSKLIDALESGNIKSPINKKKTKEKPNATSDKSKQKAPKHAAVG